MEQHQYNVFTVRADGLKDKKARTYVASVVGMLTAIERATQSGKALHDAFRAVKREVLVFPYDGALGHCNAWANGDWGMYRNKVSFSPDTWFNSSPCHSHGTAGNSPIEVLVHELVHALRFAGKQIDRRTKGDEEEQIAILVTNIFSSEMNRPLRWKHSGFDPLPDSNSVTFYGQKIRLLELMVTEHAEFSRRLARIDTAFNPFREYYDREM